MTPDTFAKLGYWRIGGPIERLERPANEDELQRAVLAAQDRGRGFFVLGKGSNLLVSDEGLAGTTVVLGGELARVDVLDDGEQVHVRVGAGVANAVLLNRHLGSLAGLGPLAGVPGTMGGAIAMNAGTSLGEIGDVVARVEGLDRDGRRVVLERADLPVRYRNGGLPEGFTVTAAVLRLSRAGAAEEKARVLEHLARRSATQPLDVPSCGSVFRNPPGDSAGRLIEAAGLKGWRHGGAQVSEKHANFIVNRGGATASDALACIREALGAVWRQHGVLLSPEVHVVGRWDEKLWPWAPDSG